MAVWMHLLRKLPWNQVINNAPLLVDGAKKLWKSLANKNTDNEPSNDTQLPAIEGDPVRFLQASISQLKNQLLDSSTLIKALADQNVELVKNLESQRKITLCLCVVTTLLSLAVILIMLRLF